MKNSMMKLFIKILTPLNIVAMIITMIFGMNVSGNETAELVSENNFYLAQALLNGQGITNDGEYYYMSGCFKPLNIECVSKYDMKTMKQVDVNYFVIPDELVRRGNNHIGCISYYDGKIYVPVEDDAREYSCMIVLDSQTLEFTGEVWELDKSLHTGNPWCAIDSSTGLLYCSNFSENDKIFIYDTRDGSFVSSLPLSMKLDKVQGGEIYGGKLFVSCDTDKSDVKHVYSIDILTGETEIAFTRNVGSDRIEAEGMTIYPTEDGSLFHVVDYDGMVGISVRNYKLSVDVSRH